MIGLIDGKSRCLTVMFAKKKNEQVDCFKAFWVVSRSFGLWIKLIKTDGGSEYCNKEIQQRDLFLYICVPSWLVVSLPLSLPLPFCLFQTLSRPESSASDALRKTIARSRFVPPFKISELNVLTCQKRY